MGRKGVSTGGGLPPSPKACVFYLPSHGLRRGLHIYRLLRRLIGPFPRLAPWATYLPPPSCLPTAYAVGYISTASFGGSQRLLGGDHAVVNFGPNQRFLKFPTRVPTGRQMDPGWGERAAARGEVCRPLRGLASSTCLPTACAVGYISTASFGGSQAFSRRGSCRGEFWS